MAVTSAAMTSLSSPDIASLYLRLRYTLAPQNSARIFSLCSPTAGTRPKRRSMSPLRAGGAGYAIFPDGVSTMMRQVRVRGQKRRIVHACKRDLRAIKLCGERRFRRFPKNFRNARIRFCAALHALDIGGEKRIARERLVLQHFLGQHAPFAVALDRDQNVRVVARLEH